jgi:hypothetical protein
MHYVRGYLLALGLVTSLVLLWIVGVRYVWGPLVTGTGCRLSIIIVSV